MDEKRADFLRADYLTGFPAHCRFRVDRVEPGLFHAGFAVDPEHRQQDGFVHAGALATLADHTAGYAAYTTVPDDARILTIEFKINFLKPAAGDEIRCRSSVLSGGRRVIVAESEVYAVAAGREKLVAKAVVTLMAVPRADLERPAVPRPASADRGP